MISLGLQAVTGLLKAPKTRLIGLAAGGVFLAFCAWKLNDWRLEYEQTHYQRGWDAHGVAAAKAMEQMIANANLAGKDARDGDNATVNTVAGKTELQGATTREVIRTIYKTEISPECTDLGADTVGVLKHAFTAGRERRRIDD